MSWFFISLILTHNHFPVAKINHSLELIGISIIMLSMNNAINLLNRNLEVFYQSSYKLSTWIPMKIFLNTQSVKLWHGTPFYLFCYLEQAYLQCFYFPLVVGHLKRWSWFFLYAPLNWIQILWRNLLFSSPCTIPL